MAIKRKINNSLALAVLAHLYEKPRHPYELASTMKERKTEASIKLNYGSLYTVIETLERSALIKAVATKRDGNRPEKTVYRITAEGTAYMLDWLRELIAEPVKEYPQFEAALTLIPALPPEEAMRLLEGRIKILKEQIKAIKINVAARLEMQLPRILLIESEFRAQLTSTELRFVEALLHDLRTDARGVTSDWRAVRRSVLGLKE